MDLDIVREPCFRLAHLLYLPNIKKYFLYLKNKKFKIGLAHKDLSLRNVIVDKNNKVLAKVCMDPGSFRRERRGNNIFYADILVPVERAFSGVRGLVNPGAFSPDDIKGFSSTRFVNAKGGIGLDIKERDFKLKQ